MQSVSSNAVAQVLNAFRQTSLYGVGNQTAVTVTPTTSFTALTETKTINIIVTKRYTIVIPFFYKIDNSPTGSYQFTLWVKIDNTEYQAFSCATIQGYISGTLVCFVDLSQGNHTISIGAKVANTQKVVNIFVPYYNLVYVSLF